MFTAYLADHKIKQDEMIRQAEAYRLVKLSAGSNALISSVVQLLSRVFGHTGQQLTISTAK